MRLITIALVACLPVAAQYCNPKQFQGTYGFQLSGTTRISGDPKPSVSVGRLEFDGLKTVKGVSSVSFTGYTLGNPVTGAYELHDDCTLTWNVQDDSGAWQHFSGKLTPDLRRGTFQQTDPDTPDTGLIAKLPEQCQTAMLKGKYDVSLSGSTIPMNPGDTAHAIQFKGTLTIDENGNVTGGFATIDSDCIVEMQLTLGADDVHLRGVLVDEANEILAMDTSPGSAVKARLLRQRQP